MKEILKDIAKLIGLCLVLLVAILIIPFFASFIEWSSLFVFNHERLITFITSGVCMLIFFIILFIDEIKSNDKKKG